jgi:uncharacterized membrane protein YdbT with pleckstrin-like domain
MFGLGPTEILLMVTVSILLLVPFVAGIAIIVSVFKYYTGKREAKLEARIEELEKRLGEQQRK